MFRIFSRRSIVLVVLDIGIILAAFALASFLCLGRWDYPLLFPEFGLVGMIYLSALHFFDYYSPFRHFPAVRTLAEMLLVVAGSMAFSVVVFYLKPDAHITRVVFLGANIFIYAGICAARLLYDDLLGSRIARLPTVIIGDGLWVAVVARLLRETPSAGLDVLGAVVPSGRQTDLLSEVGVPCLGTFDNVNDVIGKLRIRCVVLAMEEKTRAMENNVIEKLYVNNVKILSSLRVYEQITGKAPFQYFRAGHLLIIAEQITDNLYLKVKRLLDIVAVVCLSFVFLPVLTVLVLFLALESGGVATAFFVQERSGKGGRLFKMYKLRTMKDLPDGGKAVTRVGRWVRKYRLDETPQLWNILKGDMSLVGPRPETSYFVAYCRQKIPFYNIIFSVRPGLSGWAQVRFAHTTNLADYETKFCYDLFYLKNCSLTIDLFVFFETIKVVLWGRGK